MAADFTEAAPQGQMQAREKQGSELKLQVTGERKGESLEADDSEPPR
jgi:hypothetical protein